jgi:putative oxidoreductase
MREEVFWLGRLLFSLVLFDNAYRHLVSNTEGSAQYAAYKGVPNAKTVVQVTGVLMALGGLAVVLGIWMDLAGVLIAALVVIYAVKMHDFWTVTDPQTQAIERAQFMKNISIAGGGLMLAALGPLDWYTLTDGVF